MREELIKTPEGRQNITTYVHNSFKGFISNIKN